MSDTLAELQRAVVGFRDERDWEQFHQLKDLTLGLQIEASELAELFLWKTREECLDLLGEEKARGRLADEMADVLIFLLYLAEESGISLDQAVRDKLVANARKYPVETAKGSAKKYSELEVRDKTKR